MGWKPVLFLGLKRQRGCGWGTLERDLSEEDSLVRQWPLVEGLGHSKGRQLSEWTCDLMLLLPSVSYWLNQRAVESVEATVQLSLLG